MRKSHEYGHRVLDPPCTDPNGDRTETARSFVSCSTSWACSSRPWSQHPCNPQAVPVLDVPTRPHREGNGAQHGEQKYRRSAIPFSQTCVLGRSLCQTKMALDCAVSACSHTLRNAVRRRLLDLRQYQHFQSSRHGTEPSSACASRRSEM